MNSTGTLNFEKISPEQLALLRNIGQAISLSSLVLVDHPDQLAGQLTGRMLSIRDPLAVNFLESIKQAVKHPWLCPIAPCFEQVGGALLKTISGYLAEMTPNGETLITAYGNGFMSILDVMTTKERFSLQAHLKPIGSLLPFSDNKRVLSVSTDGDIKIWDIEHGGWLMTLIGVQVGIQHMFLASGDRKVIAAYADGRVVIWSIAEERILFSFSGPQKRLLQIKVVDDESRIVCCYDGGTIGIYDFETGCEQIIPTSSGISYNSVRIEVVENKIILAAVSGPLNDKNILEIYNLATAGMLQSMSWQVGGTFGAERINSLAVTRDGKWAATATGEDRSNKTIIQDYWDKTGVEQSLKVWDLVSGKLAYTLQGHTNTVVHVEFDHTEQQLFSYGNDEKTIAWDIGSGRQLRYMPQGGLYYLSEDHYLAKLGTSIKLWDLKKNEEINILVGHTGIINGVRFTPDKQKAITFAEDQTIKIWDISSDAQPRPLTRKSGIIRRIGISQRGTLAVTFGGNTWMIWEVLTGNFLQTGKGYWANLGCSFLPADGSRLLLNSDQNLTVWDLSNGERLTFCRNLGEMIAVDSTGWRIICIQGDKLIVWDLPLGKKVHEEPLEERIGVKSNAGDDRWLLKEVGDTWSLPVGSNEITFFARQKLGGYALCPGGPIIAAGGRGGDVFFLRVENAPQEWIASTMLYRPEEVAAYIRCPHCSQWTPSQIQSILHSQGELLCTNCGTQLTISKNLKSCLQSLHETSDLTNLISGNDYPSGFWLESLTHGMGGYNGICRVCGGADSDPGKPPLECPNCDWPGKM